MDQTTHNLPAPPRADGMASLKARRADNMDLMPHAPSVSLRRPLHTSRPHVVIVGGGFGGLYTARGLARTPVAVTVVDQHNYHVFRPMLYQVATGLLSADEIAAPIRSVLWKQKNTEVLMAEVIGVDTQHHLVQRQESGLPYDYLILATGAHLFRASKRAPRSCCTGPATNGGMRPIPGREPRGWGLNASIFYCPNSTRRCGSRSCGWQSTAGKAKTTRLQYRPVPRCGSEGKPMAHTHAPSHDPRIGARRQFPERIPPLAPTCGAPPADQEQLAVRCIHTMRTLAMDAVQQANSGVLEARVRSDAFPWSTNV